MNILVTGANGLLGRYLVELLSKQHKVFAIVKNKEKLSFELNENISVLEIDLSDIDTRILPKDIDAVYYLAQSNRFREFPDGVDDMLSINVVAPNTLAKWAVSNGVKKFIYASSGGVYTNPNKPVKEFFDINANEKLGFYLNSKLSAEMLLKNYASLFETFAIIRPFFMYGVGQNDLKRYALSEEEMKIIQSENIEQHFFSYYHKWVPQENYYYAAKNCGFQANQDGRSEGTYSKYASLDDKFDGFHYHMMFIKFGIGRATSDAAHEIRDGHILRDEGVALVRKYDGEFPKKYFEDFLCYCDITEDYYWKTVDSWRSPHIWSKVNGDWELKVQVS